MSTTIYWSFARRVIGPARRRQRHQIMHITNIAVQPVRLQLDDSERKDG